MTKFWVRTASSHFDINIKIKNDIKNRIKNHRIKNISASGLALLISVIASLGDVPEPARAENIPSCRLESKEIIYRANLLKAGINGDSLALAKYDQLVSDRAIQLARCRQQNWPRTMGIWLRVYPCDLKPGQLEQVLDNISNFGYNRIYLNTFYDGRVLLPKAANPTVWPSVVGNEAPNADLLAQTIAQARRRGISVHAWLFAMNFGPSYAARADRQSAIARNGYGETNLQDPTALPEEARVKHVFVDPYNMQARNDLRSLVQAVAERRPDGISFDYIRYPHRTESMVSAVRDLMIYGVASTRALLGRALTPEGQELIYQYLQQGKVATAEKNKGSVLWEFPTQISLKSQVSDINQELWQLVTAHARRGVVEFLDSVAQPARLRGIPVGAAFFPKANISSGTSVDARLQPWSEFNGLNEWQPMSYSICGSANCIVDEITRVMQQVKGNPVVCPILAGYWNLKRGDRIALELQMRAVYQNYPQLSCVSHFAYSWLDMNSDRERRSCKLEISDLTIK